MLPYVQAVEGNVTGKHKIHNIAKFKKQTKPTKLKPTNQKRKENHNSEISHGTK